MKSVQIYSDGACSGNPGPGGWACILRYGNYERVLSGGAVSTTNNRMELEAVIKGLWALRQTCKVEVFTDSQYIANAINEGWLTDWQKRGWKRKTGELKNPDLWKSLQEMLEKHEVTCTWVKGHADNELNNRCDALAVEKRDKMAKIAEKQAARKSAGE